MSGLQDTVSSPIGAYRWEYTDRALTEQLLLEDEGQPATVEQGRSDPWLQGLLAKRPRLVAAVALANKTARIAWAVMARQQSYRQAAPA